jgi:hypothetical protein
MPEVRFHLFFPSSQTLDCRAYDDRATLRHLIPQQVFSGHDVRQHAMQTRQFAASARMLLGGGLLPALWWNGCPRNAADTLKHNRFSRSC